MERLDVKQTFSQGIVTAPVHRYAGKELSPEMGDIDESQVSEEENKFRHAREEVMKDLEKPAEKDPLFDAYLQLAQSNTLEQGVLTRIRSKHKNVQAALYETVEETAQVFDTMEDDYMRERARDIRDIGRRFMSKLKHVSCTEAYKLQTPSVIVARELFPSDLVRLDPSMIRGILTEKGGATDHVTIWAKSKNIPVITGVKDIFEKTVEGQILCMDAKAGEIVLSPDAAALREYEHRKQAMFLEEEELRSLRDQIPIFRDRRIRLCVNAGNLEDVRLAAAHQADGIGLFRSEFLYMEKDHFPTEEEQFEVYSQAVRLCPRELTIRTLDIGGDKKLPYYSFPKEQNPFLGWRGIRVSLELREVFQTQLRAILRASVQGKIRILFPMIISPEELQEAKKVLEECKDQLRKEGQEFDETIQIGIMMETPSSVLLAEEFAEMADFFSIGTNDLTQYLLAVDRGNEKVADRYDFFHPAVKRAVLQICQAAQKAGISVGMCGEMAGDVRAVPFLLEAGLDEFSMSVGNLDAVRGEILRYASKEKEE